MGFPGGASGIESTCQCRRHKRHELDLWVGKIPWRKWQPTPVFLPGESQWTEPGRLQSIGSQSWMRLSTKMLSLSHTAQRLRCPESTVTQSRQERFGQCFPGVHNKYRSLSNLGNQSIIHTIQGMKAK